MAISKTESVKKVKLNLKGLTPEGKERAKRIAGEILVDGINQALDSASSPVEGGSYESDKADGTPSELFEDGFMRNEIKSRPANGDAVEVGIFQDAPLIERLKGYNHNVGETLPQRRFIAAPNQVFKESIMNRVDDAIQDIRKDRKPSKAREFGVEGLISDEDLVQSILKSIGFEIEIEG